MSKLFHLTRHKLVNILNLFFEHHVYTCRRGLTRGLKRQGGLGFTPQFRCLTQEEQFLAKLEFEKLTVYDVGAFTGLLTIFFARSVGPYGLVIAFEPNPYLCKIIRRNTFLNEFKNVHVIEKAVGKNSEDAVLAFPTWMKGVGSIRDSEVNRISSIAGARTLTVRVASLDKLVGSGELPKPDFVKIDTQGFELDVLRGMNNIIYQFKPRLFVEIHAIGARWKTELEELIHFLLSAGYSIFHVESNSSVNEENCGIVREDEHLYCH